MQQPRQAFVLLEIHRMPKTSRGLHLQHSVAASKACLHPERIEHRLFLQAQPNYQARGKPLNQIEQMPICLFAQITRKTRPAV